MTTESNGLPSVGVGPCTRDPRLLKALICPRSHIPASTLSHFDCDKVTRRSIEIIGFGKSLMNRRNSGEKRSQPSSCCSSGVHQMLAPDEAAAFGGMNHFQLNCICIIVS